jgi:hypothetical protein
MLRSILAVVAGTFVLLVAATVTDAVLLKLFPAFTDARGRVSSNAVAFLMMSYAIAYCVLAGYVAALVARRREVAHALALGVWLTLALVYPTIKFWDTTPAWYHVALFVLTLPACVAGGRWRLVRKGRGRLRGAVATT